MFLTPNGYPGSPEHAWRVHTTRKCWRVVAVSWHVHYADRVCVISSECLINPSPLCVRRELSIPHKVNKLNSQLDRKYLNIWEFGKPCFSNLCMVKDYCLSAKYYFHIWWPRDSPCTLRVPNPRPTASPPPLSTLSFTDLINTPSRPPFSIKLFTWAMAVVREVGEEGEAAGRAKMGLALEACRYSL